MKTGWQQQIVSCVPMLCLLLLSAPAHAFYNPVEGRWLSRDPIGEKGGLNLCGFVGNEPVSRSDFLGWDHNLPLAVVEKHCCGNPVKIYDPKKHCCCKGGAVVGTDFSPECRLVEVKPILSGVVKHTGDAPGSPGTPQKHVWLSWSGYGVDGSVDSNAPNLPSQDKYKVSSPANYQVESYPAEEYSLSPCEYDFEKLHHCLSNESLRRIGGNGGLCYEFIEVIMSFCLKESKGCTAN